MPVVQDLTAPESVSNFNRTLLVALAALLLPLCCGAIDADAVAGDQLRVVNLRTEYQINPIGIDTNQPRLSWQMQSSTRGVWQSAYQIRVAGTERDVQDGMHLLFDSGKVTSDQSIQLPYSGPRLQSRQRYYWQVRVWDTQGHTTRWSHSAFWEMGLLSERDWRAQWIEPQIDRDPNKSVPAPMLRSKFELRSSIVRARAYVTSLGLYEFYLNGKRVGDALFTPGWTSYDKRLQYQVYDVITQLKPGVNAVGVILGDGWYRRESFNARGHHNNGKPMALLMQLEITYEDGRTQTIASNKDWRAATGPILLSELYNGEVYDARLERNGWTTAGYDDHEWSPIKVVSPTDAALIATVGPPVRRVEELHPVRIFKTLAGTTIVDMGQSMVGWVRLRVRGRTGATVTLRHAEVLDRAGAIYTDGLRTARQTIQYILKGRGDEVFEPHFTVQGFRYVEVEGYPGEIKPDSLTGVVIHSDMQRTGSLETSNELINRLQHNIVWSQKSNYLDVPTDCPQRDERLGWGFDTELFSATGALNMNVATFLTKWLGDLAADQTSEGAVPLEIPRTLFGSFPLRAFLQGAGRESNDSRLLEWTGAPGYSDAATIVPWNLYLAYGDVHILQAQYKSMRRWVEYMQLHAGRDFNWNPDLNLGDWLDTASTSRPTKFGVTADDLIATAFYAHSADILQRAAAILGKDADAARYAELFAKIRQVFRDRFVSDDGRVGAGTQTAYVLALDFDLLPDTMRPRAAHKLAEDVRARGHLTTGLAGTQHLLTVLSRFGFNDEAYLLLERREMPSWLYPITRGATTIWERWDGIRPDGSFQNAEMNSFNQYALGAIGEWMYGTMAGIALDPALPGYKHSLLEPRPGGGLTEVNGNLETMHGHLSSHWSLQDGLFVMEIEVPPNTRATVRLPRAFDVEVREGGQSLKEMIGIIGNPREDADGVLVEVGSGKYRFSYPWKPGRPTMEARR